MISLGEVRHLLAVETIRLEWETMLGYGEVCYMLMVQTIRLNPGEDRCMLEGRALRLHIVMMWCAILRLSLWLIMLLISLNAGPYRLIHIQTSSDISASVWNTTQCTCLCVILSHLGVEGEGSNNSLRIWLFDNSC